MLLFSANTHAKGIDTSLPRFFYQQPSDYVSSIPYGNNAKVGKYVQADDAKIYYEVYGKGEPFLVLHGGGVGVTYEMGQFIDTFGHIELLNKAVRKLLVRHHPKNPLQHLELFAQIESFSYGLYNLSVLGIIGYFE